MYDPPTWAEAEAEAAEDRLWEAHDSVCDNPECQKTATRNLADVCPHWDEIDPDEGGDPYRSRGLLRSDFL